MRAGARRSFLGSCNGSATFERVTGVPMAASDADPVWPREQLSDAVDSFDAFHLAQYRPAVRLAVALVGRRDVAEELVQDAFVALQTRWERISAYESPEGWLRRVVANRSVSALRRRAVEARLLVRLANQRARRVEIPENDRDLWRIVARLPKRQAQVVALIFVDGLTVGEVAVTLGCAENTVRTHLRRAKVTLAERLGTETEDQ